MAKGSLSKVEVGAARDVIAELGVQATVEHCENGGFDVQSKGMTIKQRMQLEARLRELGLGSGREQDSE